MVRGALIEAFRAAKGRARRGVRLHARQVSLYRNLSDWILNDHSEDAKAQGHWF